MSQLRMLLAAHLLEKAQTARQMLGDKPVALAATPSDPQPANRVRRMATPMGLLEFLNLQGRQHPLGHHRKGNRQSQGPLQPLLVQEPRPWNGRNLQGRL